MKNDGFGSLGTPWHLKSMHDDIDATGAQIVGEEFEIDAPDPQNWAITLADNGISFTETTAADSLTVNGMTANQPGTQHNDRNGDRLRHWREDHRSPGVCGPPAAEQLALPARARLVRRASPAGGPGLAGSPVTVYS